MILNPYLLLFVTLSKHILDKVVACLLSHRFWTFTGCKPKIERMCKSVRVCVDAVCHPWNFLLMNSILCGAVFVRFFSLKAASTLYISVQIQSWMTLFHHLWLTCSILRISFTLHFFVLLWFHHSSHCPLYIVSNAAKSDYSITFFFVFFLCFVIWWYYYGEC